MKLWGRRREIKMKRERGKENIVRSVKKGLLAFFDYFNRIFNVIFLQLF